MYLKQAVVKFVTQQDKLNNGGWGEPRINAENVPMSFVGVCAYVHLHLCLCVCALAPVFVCVLNRVCFGAGSSGRCAVVAQSPLGALRTLLLDGQGGLPVAMGGR